MLENQRCRSNFEVVRENPNSEASKSRDSHMTYVMFKYFGTFTFTFTLTPAPWEQSPKGQE
jgi:hypothetical protein